MRVAAPRPGGPRRFWRSPLSGLIALGLTLSWSAAGAASLEYQVKAAYLYKLLSFVDWPAGSLPPPGAPLNLCVVGDDPFGSVLDQAAQNQKVDGRSLLVRRIATVSKSSDCQVLYIAGSKRQSVANALQAVKGAPSLTITEASEARGSIVQFVVKEGRVRFTIDVTAAAQNGLTISAKLLSLALSVRDGPVS